MSGGLRGFDRDDKSSRLWATQVLLGQHNIRLQTLLEYAFRSEVSASIVKDILDM